MTTINTGRNCKTIIPQPTQSEEEPKQFSLLSLCSKNKCTSGERTSGYPLHSAQLHLFRQAARQQHVPAPIPVSPQGKTGISLVRARKVEIPARLYAFPGCQMSAPGPGLVCSSNWIPGRQQHCQLASSQSILQGSGIRIFAGSDLLFPLPIRKTAIFHIPNPDRPFAATRSQTDG